MQTLCGWEAVGCYCWVLLETIFCRSLKLCIWPDSEPTKLLDHCKQKSRREEGLRQINTCHKVSLQVLVNFFRWWRFALLSISLIFQLILFYPFLVRIINRLCLQFLTKGGKCFKVRKEFWSNQFKKMHWRFSKSEKYNFYRLKLIWRLFKQRFQAIINISSTKILF